MAVGLHLDVHIPRAIVQELRRRGVDLLTAQEDSAQRLSDQQLLDRATQLGRVLVTSDHDFLAVADDLLARGCHFAGIVFFHPLRVSIGAAVKDLELLARVAEAADLLDRVAFLPLRRSG